MGRRMPDAVLGEFSRFVEAAIGLSFPRERWADLERGLHTVCEQHCCDNEETFARKVMSTDLSKRQIAMLAGGLTVGETYFFREKRAFDALEHIIHSEAIKRTGNGAERSLRIWSAGCASGEEPYSIAMVLKMQLPDLRDWNITILATDINPLFLEKAEKGVYSAWSFRDVPERIIRRFFTKRGSDFELVSEIRNMVTFSHHNLMQDDYPALLNGTNAMDVIFCRNVLMYFSPETIKSVTRKFHRSLTDGGRLVVSQTELNDEYFQQFEKMSYAGAMLFTKSARQTPLIPLWQRGKQGVSSSLEPGTRSLDRIHLPASSTGDTKGEGEIGNGVSEEVHYLQASQAFEQGDYRGTEAILRRMLEGSPGNAEALSLMARVCANQGRLDDALRHIAQAIEADTLSPGRHYLHAAILREKGLKQEAMAALKKAVYLDADFALAYYGMGSLALGSGDMADAERHFDNALLLLKRHGRDDILPESEGLAAGRLIDLIGSMKWRKRERGQRHGMFGKGQDLAGAGQEARGRGPG